MMTRLKRPSASNLQTGSLLAGSSEARSAQNVDDTASVEAEGKRRRLFCFKLFLSFCLLKAVLTTLVQYFSF